MIYTKEEYFEKNLKDKLITKTDINGFTNQYLPIKYAVEWFTNVYPNGRIKQNILDYDKELKNCLVEAEIYFDATNSTPNANSIVFGERDDSTGINFVQWTLTRATGKALALAGFGCSNVEETDTTNNNININADNNIEVSMADMLNEAAEVEKQNFPVNKTVGKVVETVENLTNEEKIETTEKEEIEKKPRKPRKTKKEKELELAEIQSEKEYENNENIEKEIMSEIENSEVQEENNENQMTFIPVAEPEIPESDSENENEMEFTDDFKFDVPNFPDLTLGDIKKINGSARFYIINYINENGTASEIAAINSL